MAAANWHTYQVLTKRSDRLRQLLQTDLAFAASLSHIWWGVSVENRKYGLPRIKHLRDARTAMAFLSVEPLLEDLGDLELDRIKWVIVGGESGAGARPMKREWVVNIQCQCVKADVPFFFKQWGGVRKSLGGRELDGQTYDECPMLTQNQVPDADERNRLLRQFAGAWPGSPLRRNRQTA
jgi:protein gp37